MPKTEHDPPWTPAEIRAWVERHGGNISAAARLLRVPRHGLQIWLADPERSIGAQPLPPSVQRSMELMDEIAMLRAGSGADELLAGAANRSSTHDELVDMKLGNSEFARAYVRELGLIMDELCTRLSRAEQTRVRP